MNYSEKIIGDIEEHSVQGIRECFENGVSPNDLFNGVPLIYELTSEYLRSPQFRECVKLFVDFGLVFDDQPLLAVLLDDASALEGMVKKDPGLISKKYTLKSAFTPLQEATLMHICAEHNHLSCAEILSKYGADINAKAGLDEFGFGGHSPIFHTVNQIHNNSSRMLQYLLNRKADLSITVPGLIWGRGYTWETFIPSVNPISYAMMGFLPQMHRKEKTISEIVSILMKHRYGIDYVPLNIPCKYLIS